MRAILERAIAAILPTLKVVAWIAASAAVDAVITALRTGQVEVDPVLLPAVNVALFYVAKLLEGRKPATATGG